MQYTAIIFDLLGTLIGDFSRTRYEDVYVCMARAVQLPSDVFRHAFGQTFHDRTIGQYASIEQNIAHVCTQLGMSPTATALQAAAAHRYAFTRSTLTPSPDVLAALDALKRAGFRLGLLSNCGPDVPHLWQECPLAASIDVAVFSCQERRKKPALALYQTACQRLHCPPAACVYVGDGSDEELTGAKQAGLVPVLKRTDLQDVYDQRRPEVEAWQGHVIHAIHELPQFLKALEALGQQPS